MNVLLLFVTLQHVVWADDPIPVSAYVGENVTLPSGADPSWELSSITWSILANTTFIATHFKNNTNVDQFYKYHGRLDLDVKTGDLVIKHLKSEDTTVYTVELINSEQQPKERKIKLNVKQHLQQPTISTRLSPGADSCLFALQCSSPDPEVTLSWQTQPNFHDYNKINNTLLVGILSKTLGAVEFTCVSSKNGDSAPKTESLKCEAEAPPPPVTCPSPASAAHSDQRLISRDPVLFVVGLFVPLAVICCLKMLQWYMRSRTQPEGNGP